MAAGQYVETDMWDEPAFSGYTIEQKILYIYLRTNKRVNPAGFYRIKLSDMESDTQIKNIESVLRSLAPAVIFDEKSNMLWLTSWVEKYSTSPKIRKSIENTIATCVNSLTGEVNCDLALQFLEKNKWLELHRFDNVLIGYRNPIGAVPIASIEQEQEQEQEEEQEEEKERASPVPKVPAYNAERDILAYWNEKEIIRHSESETHLAKIKKALKKRKENIDDIYRGIDNYDKVLKGDTYYTHIWKLWEFIARGESFLPNGYIESNYFKKNNSGGSGQIIDVSELI